MEIQQFTQTATQKKHFRTPKNILFASLLFLTILGMIGGIFVMQKNDSTKIANIRMKVPFQKDTPITTLPPSPQPTINPTLNWQTYANKSFSFKYPSRFTIQEQTIPYTILYPKIYSSVSLFDGESTITVTAARNSANYSLKTIPGNGPFIRYSSNLIDPNTKKAQIIAGNDAIITEKILTAKNGTAKDVLLIHNNKVYQLTLSPIDIDPTTFNALLTTLLLLDQEPADITDSWQVYIDNHYGYSLKYPNSYKLEHEKTASIPAQSIIYDNNTIQIDPAKFKVEVLDIRNIGLSDTTSRNILLLPLEQFVNKKWDYNKASSSAFPNKTVSALKELTISGEKAFEFMVIEEYRDDRGSERLTSEYKFFFTENAGYKFKIWYPKSNTIFEQILNTFIFTK